MDNETRRYRGYEIERIGIEIPGAPEPEPGTYKVQLSGIAGRSKWLNITREELDAIRAVLTEEA